MRRPIILFGFLLAIGSQAASGQTYECAASSGANCRAPIPDGAGELVSTLNVSPTACQPGTTVADVNLHIDILHEWLGDLELILTNPTGTSQILYSRPFLSGSGYGCATDDIGAVFSDEGLQASYLQCSSALPSVGGFVIPANPLSVFDGGTRNGTWTLTVRDKALGGAGMLKRWALEIPCVVPTVTVAASDPDASEFALDTASFTFQRTPVSQDPLVVNFTRSGTATFQDAQLASSPVTIPGGSATAVLFVNPKDDTLAEGDETVIITVGPGEYQIGAPSSAQAVIHDDEGLEFPADFDGDGDHDLLWRNYGTGAVNVWFLDGTTYTGGKSLFTVADTDWRIEGTGDFNGDGKTDIIWRDYGTGAVNVWYLNGTVYAGGVSLFGVADLNWEIEAVGDFNGDGNDDLIWRNYATGAVNAWFMNGSTYLGGASLFSVPDANWKIEAPGDFNGDGKTDLIWRNYASGAVNVWFLNGTTYLGGKSLFTVADPLWNIEAAEDYNGDGKTDLIWRHYGDGRVNAWFLDGTTYLGGASLFQVSDLNWEIAGPR